jgi:hypothetical protein
MFLEMMYGKTNDREGGEQEARVAKNATDEN